MFTPSIIFQRTLAGRDEIRQKSHGLTQSERLVLIMIDGVAPCGEVRNKLPALSDERFERALHRLSQKELVLEVFMPVEGQVADELERSIIDRFLQQDPLDPVTIILRDPDDELEGHMGLVPQPTAPREITAPAEIPSVAPVDEVEAPIVPVLNQRTEPLVAMDEVHQEMADSLALEVRQRQIARAQQKEECAFTPLPVLSVEPAIVHTQRVHWGYWLIGLGCALIASFFVAKLSG